MDDHASEAISYIHAMRSEAEGLAELRRAELLRDLAWKVNYSVQRSLKELEPGISGDYVSSATAEYEAIQAASNEAFKLGMAKLDEAKGLLDRINAERVTLEWPTCLSESEN